MNRETQSRDKIHCLSRVVFTLIRFPLLWHESGQFFFLTLPPLHLTIVPPFFFVVGCFYHLRANGSEFAVLSPKAAVACARRFTDGGPFQLLVFKSDIYEADNLLLVDQRRSWRTGSLPWKAFLPAWTQIQVLVVRAFSLYAIHANWTLKVGRPGAKRGLPTSRKN